MHAVPRTPSFPILAVLCGALLAGCDQPSTAPAALASKPRLNFANGPAAAG